MSGAGAAVRHIEARTHGRVVVRDSQRPPRGTIVGFHGYAEDADIYLAALEGIPGADDWRLVAIQALHPFYTRQQRVVASWMTNQDRELAIADNLDYVRRTLAALSLNERDRIVFAGFSQGGAMAYRAAAHLGAAALVILAADVPPDVAAMPGLRLPPVLIGRGSTDQWYTAEKHAADLATLERLGAAVESCVFDGGHEWSPAFYGAVTRFLGATVSGEL